MIQHPNHGRSNYPTSHGRYSLLGVSLGDIYQCPKTDRLFRVIALCDRPTVELENVETGDQSNFVIGSPLFRMYRRLVPDSASSRQPDAGEA